MAVDTGADQASELAGDERSALARAEIVLRGGELELQEPAGAGREHWSGDAAVPAIVKAQKPDLRASDTIDDAVAKIVAATTKQILGNLAAAEAGRDPEGVHQLRVGIRRLRSALSLFRKYLGPSARALNAQARSAFRGLSLARDLDAFLLETLPRVAQAAAGTVDLGPVAAAARSQRDVIHDEVRLLLRGHAFNLMLTDLVRSASNGALVVQDQGEPLRPTASRLLQKRHRKLLQAGEDFDRLTVAERHVVRIKLKRLRYACDSFQGIYPGGLAAPYLQKQSSLQDLFGRLNDVTMAATIAQDLAKRDPRAVGGADAVRAWQFHQRKVIEPRLRDAWYNFARRAPFWQE